MLRREKAERETGRCNLKYTGQGCLGDSVKHPPLDFGSSHDLRVVRLRPESGSALSREPAPGLSLFKIINKYIFKKNKQNYENIFFRLSY